MRNFRLDDESGHQEALFSWAAYRTEIMPELQYMYHVPNGGKRDKATAAVLKRQGVKAGVPDIMLPAARAGYHGLYIELKAGENTTTKKQKECGNFIYVQGAADDDGSQPVTTVDGEGATGLDLVEVFCDATDIARKYQQGETEVTIPLNTYIAMLKTRGGAELENYGKNINFVSTINTNSNLKFKADFDLGDRITCKETKWGIQIDARITEVTETYQKGEETIEATFGDSLPTLVDQIRKVR